MPDIRIVPGSSTMSFTSSLNYIEKITQDPSGSLTLYGSGSTGRTELFSIDGNNGRLFSVSDDLSDSLFSVNTIAGLPVIEAFADNTVKIGKFGAEAIKVSGSNAIITGSLFGTSSWADNAVTSSFITGSNVFGPFGPNSVISASFATTASYALTSETLQDPNYVKNNTDTYTSTAKVSQIITLTSVEYSAIGTKDSGTLYVII
jgi:hypothetical protein